MATIDALCFDVWARYGTFRVPATTRGHLTYPFIPRTAAVGLIASMLGVERNEAYKDGHFLYSAKIGIRCLNSPKMVGFRTNLIRTKNTLKFSNNISIYLPKDIESGYRSPHTEIYLQSPRFRIFTHFNDRLEELEERLAGKNFHYIPYFGRANMLCFPEFVGRVQLRECKSRKKYLHTLFEAGETQEIKTGKYTIIIGVPMNYSFTRQHLTLSRMANIVYYTADQQPEITIESDNQGDCYTIEDGPETIVRCKGKQIAFLPWQ